MKKYFFLALLVILLGCKKDNQPDPCAGITCLNGGTCANGQCVCTQGYTGANCSQQVTPTKITITKIQVTKFPATEVGGAGWDLTSGPDIRPRILKGTTEIWYSPTYYTDANPSLVYDFTPSPNIDLTSPTDQYTIELFDFDSPDTDDWMGGLYFIPYSNNNNFPAVITIDATGSGVAFKLYVTYTW
jgi:hypothetical protein